MQSTIKEPFLVFDLETQRDIQSVGGRANLDKLLMSVGVVWDSRDNLCHSYYESDVPKLVEHLISGPLIIGFNHILFDFAVLSGYSQELPNQQAINNLYTADNFDIMLAIKEVLGHFVSLDSLVRPTLNAQKSAHGLLALEWFESYKKSGDSKWLTKIKDYCQQDVLITRDLYVYGCTHAKVFHEKKNGEVKPIDCSWVAARTRLHTPSTQKPDSVPQGILF